jgi:hypothetical protein
MGDEDSVLRGAPRYLRGPAAGRHGALALVPQAVVGADGVTRPSELIVLLPGGIRRIRLGRAHAAATEGLAPSPGDSESVARSWIVAGESGPPEDPRVTAAFGPTEVIAGGARIPLAVATPDAAGGFHCAPAGAVTVRGGAAHVDGPRLVGRRALAIPAAGLLLALGWALRRGRRR